MQGNRVVGSVLNPVQIAYDGVADILQVKDHIPLAFWIMFWPLHKVRAVWHLWRLQKEIKSVAQPENQTILDALVMRGVERILDQSQAMRMLSYVVLLTRNINRCRQTMSEITTSWEDLKAALRARDSMQALQHPKWVILDENGAFCSPSTYNWIASKGAAFSQSSFRIAVCVARIFSNLFLLSMYFLETVDTYFINTKDPKHDLRMRELLQNGIANVDQFNMDLKTSLAFIKKEEATARAILSKIGGEYTYDGLIAFFDTSITVSGGAGTALHYTADTFSSITRKASEGALSMFGFKARPVH